MRTKHALATISLTTLLTTGLTGCGGAAPDLSGAWSADDGSGVKTFQDNGACTGMYYNQGKPLDIGGGMTCTLGGDKDDQGRYMLQVQQPPNSETLLVSFDGENATVYNTTGERLFTMTKQ